MKPLSRSYGDSSPVTLSETSTLEDGLAVVTCVWSMFQDKADDQLPNLVLWGHSLGTSIAARTALEHEPWSPVTGLVLESPFNTMEDELNNFSTVTWTTWLLGLVIEHFN